MMSKITGAMETLSKMNYRSVIILFLLCVIGLGSFYTYRKIESLEFAVEAREIVGPRDKYFQEFGLERLKDDRDIRDILTEIRLTTESTSVVLWGYHNGVSVGPFPFKKMSVLDESVEPGAARMSREYQDTPLSLFVDLTVEL